MRARFDRAWWMAPLLITMLPLAASAGPVFVPGTFTTDETFERAADAAPTVPIRFADIHAGVNEGRVYTEMEFRLDAAAGPVTLAVPLPAGGTGNTFLMQRFADGRRERIAPAEHAPDMLMKLAEVSGERRLLAATGRPLFLSDAPFIMEPRGFNQLMFRGEWPLAQTDGMHRVDLDLPTTAGDGARLRARMTIRADAPVRSVISPTHAIEVRRQSATEIEVVLTDETSGDGTWTVMWAADPKPLGLRVLTHRAEGEDGGWFAVLGTATAGGQAAIAKDVVLALDTSGSMRGEKMEQARLAAEAVLDRLGPDDRFDIVAFGDTVRAFAGEPVGRDRAEDARRFIDGLVAQGRTHVSGALVASLKGADASERPRIVLFLTDGTPTAGVRVPEAIVKSVPDDSPARVFALGVGDDVNAHLLDAIAERTGGRSIYVDEGDAIDVEVAALYDALSHPVMSNVTVDFGGLETRAVHPAEVPLLFRGEPLMVLGRYTGGGVHAITLTGTVAGETQTHRIEADFPAAARADNAFVASLWATRRIGEVLRQLRLDDVENKDGLVAEVVELAQRFGIFTEYTAFLADADEPITTEQARARVGVLLDTANRHQSGRWAVRQADNEQNLRRKTVVSSASNFYRDRQGRTRKGDNVRLMGGKAFYKRGDRWVEAKDGKERRRRKVKKGSAEYRALLENNRDFARAQQLDADVTVNVGDESVEVY